MLRTVATMNYGMLYTKKLDTLNFIRHPFIYIADGI